VPQALAVDFVDALQNRHIRSTSGRDSFSNAKRFFSDSWRAIERRPGLEDYWLGWVCRGTAFSK
jgi:hypothetical protein